MLFGMIEVRDEAHVRLVDAHAEGNGRHHHDGIVADEAAEMFAASLVFLVRVIGQRVDTGVLQEGGGLVHGLARETVDDAGMAGVLLANEMQELLAGVVALGDPVADVRAIEARDEDARVESSFNRVMISLRVVASAVAVSAMRGTPG